MDVSGFLGGRFLTHLDLTQGNQVWTVRNVTQEMCGTDSKVCIHFVEHAKPLGCNKVNLRVVVAAFGTQAQAWIGQRIELLKDRCQFQGRMVECIRLRVPPPQPAVQALQPQVAWQPQPPIPVSPVPQPPVQPPQPQPQQPAVGQQGQPQPGVVASPGAPAWGSL